MPALVAALTWAERREAVTTISSCDYPGAAVISTAAVSNPLFITLPSARFVGKMWTRAGRVSRAAAQRMGTGAWPM
ncbi:MAG: hypothetical protein JWN21_1035 [Sphingomonas bacterium]|nr:hypothetical protein [Sphingomonas bacterium]